VEFIPKGELPEKGKENYKCNQGKSKIGHYPIQNGAVELFGNQKEIDKIRDGKK
jgi:hypothetical protein